MTGKNISLFGSQSQSRGSAIMRTRRIAPPGGLGLGLGWLPLPNRGPPRPATTATATATATATVTATATASSVSVLLPPTNFPSWSRSIRTYTYVSITGAAPSVLQRNSGRKVNINIYIKRGIAVSSSFSSPSLSPSIINSITTTTSKSFHTTTVPLQIRCELFAHEPCNCPECQRGRKTSVKDSNHFLCSSCVQKRANEYTPLTEEEQATLQNKLAAHLKNIIQKLIPIDHVVKKLMSSKVGQRHAFWDVVLGTEKGQREKFYRNRMREKLSEELLIRKVRGKIMCDKQRAEAMDFELWYRAENVDGDFWEMK